MVLIALLVWLKMRSGALERDVIGVDDPGFASYNYGYGGDPETGEPPECVWPCDAAAMAWKDFVRHNRESSLHLAMLVFEFIICVPSWFVTYFICSHYGLRMLYCFLPTWVAVDVVALATYYALRFGSGMFCSVSGRMRFHPCFSRCGRSCVLAFIGCARRISRASRSSDSTNRFSAAVAQHKRTIKDGGGVEMHSVSSETSRKNSLDDIQATLSACKTGTAANTTSSPVVPPK